MKLEDFISELMPALSLATEARACLRVDDACNGVSESVQTAMADEVIKRASKAIAIARKEGVQS